MHRFLESVRADGRRIADVVAGGPADAPVPGCPGWTLVDLGAHMGRIHRWVTLTIETRAQPDPGAIDQPPDGSEPLGAWVRAGVDRLVATLASRSPDEPTWHPFTAPQVVGVWPRRQAQETMIHRWDAEGAVGTPAPLPADLAADGILEYFELIIPRVMTRDSRSAPAGVLRVECPDVGLVCTVSSAATVDV